MLTYDGKDTENLPYWGPEDGLYDFTMHGHPGRVVAMPTGWMQDAGPVVVIDFSLGGTRCRSEEISDPEDPLLGDVLAFHKGVLDGGNEEELFLDHLLVPLGYRLTVYMATCLHAMTEDSA